MTEKKLGGQTAALACPPVLAGWANVVGQKEGAGPLGPYFDVVAQDDSLGQPSWERAERLMQQQALSLALDRAGPGAPQPDWLFAGDLLNQCIGASYAARAHGLPYFGLYGACSTLGEGLCLAAMTLDGGFGQRAGVVVSSHFCTAERQYRMPVPYGSQRTPTAQWTTTAAGCTILGSDGPGPYVTHVTCGRIVDKGITDANNMGAAMAPAAYDTLSAFFRDTGYKPADFDLILTGDLGELGHAIVRDFFQRDGVDMGPQFQDCGLLLYDRKHQDMHAGASGCGCSASVLNGYLLRKMREGKWKTILFAPTGALLSPTSSGQGESIPSICHAVRLSAVRE